MAESLDRNKVERKFKEAQDSLVLQSSDLSLATLADMIENGAIEIDPKYQRRERWSSEKQSALIESFILNVPIPPVYLAEDDYGNYSVIDGKQRLTAISLFLNNRLTLVALEKFDEIEGAQFSDLPNSIRNALNIRPYVRVVTLLKQSDPDIKYEVFTRLNTGGEPLLPQEIRNVAYRGKLNDLVFKLAESDFLKKQLKIKDSKAKPYRTMMDAEYVLRYFTLMESWEDFSGKMRLSMDLFMREHQHESVLFVRKLERKFNAAMECCISIWGDRSFKRSISGQWRNQILAGMYDAQMIGVSRLSKAQKNRAIERKKQVVKAMAERLESDLTFENSVRQFTSNPERVAYRIETLFEILTSV